MQHALPNQPTREFERYQRALQAPRVLPRSCLLIVADEEVGAVQFLNTSSRVGMPTSVHFFARVVTATCIGSLLSLTLASAQRPQTARPAPTRTPEPSLAETSDWLQRWLPQIGGMRFTTRVRGPRYDATTVSWITILSAQVNRCDLSYDEEVNSQIDGHYGTPSRFHVAVSLDALDPATIVLRNLTGQPPQLPTLEQSPWWIVSMAARGASHPVRQTSLGEGGDTLWQDTLGLAVQDQSAGVRVKAALTRALTLCAPTVRKEPF